VIDSNTLKYNNFTLNNFPLYFDMGNDMTQIIQDVRCSVNQ